MLATRTSVLSIYEAIHELSKDNTEFSRKTVCVLAPTVGQTCSGKKVTITERSVRMAALCDMLESALHGRTVRELFGTAKEVFPAGWELTCFCGDLFTSGYKERTRRITGETESEAYCPIWDVDGGTFECGHHFVEWAKKHCECVEEHRRMPKKVREVFHLRECASARIRLNQLSQQGVWFPYTVDGAKVTWERSRLSRSGQWFVSITFLVPGAHLCVSAGEYGDTTTVAEEKASATVLSQIRASFNCEGLCRQCGVIEHTEDGPMLVASDSE